MCIRDSAGRLDEAALDALCARVLRLALAHAPQRKKAYPAPVHHVAAVRRMLARHHALALCAARLGMHFSNNPAVNRRVCEMTVRDLPFKNRVLNTSGIIRYPAAEALLALANGRLFSRGGTVPVSYTHLDVYKRQCCPWLA